MAPRIRRAGSACTASVLVALLLGACAIGPPGGLPPPPPIRPVLSLIQDATRQHDAALMILSVPRELELNSLRDHPDWGRLVYVEPVPTLPHTLGFATVPGAALLRLQGSVSVERRTSRVVRVVVDAQLGGHRQRGNFDGMSLGGNLRVVRALLTTDQSSDDDVLVVYAETGP